jgi:hypothetical protein
VPSGALPEWERWVGGDWQKARGALEDDGAGQGERGGALPEERQEAQGDGMGNFGRLGRGLAMDPLLPRLVLLAREQRLWGKGKGRPLEGEGARCIGGLTPSDFKMVALETVGKSGVDQMVEV